MGAQESAARNKNDGIEIGEEFDKSSGLYKVWSHVNTCTKNKKTKGEWREEKGGKDGFRDNIHEEMGLSGGDEEICRERGETVEETPPPRGGDLLGLPGEPGAAVPHDRKGPSRFPLSSFDYPSPPGPRSLYSESFLRRGPLRPLSNPGSVALSPRKGNPSLPFPSFFLK